MKVLVQEIGVENSEDWVIQKTFKYALKNYKEISKKGRSYVEKNYSSDLMCRKTLDIYNHLINS